LTRATGAATAACAVYAACAAGLLAWPLAATALPMGSLGTWMLMGDANAGSRDLSANYAITPRDALGGGLARWDDGGRLRETAGLNYTRLVRRWNLPHAQANLWFVGQAGAARLAGGEGAGAAAARAPFASLAVLADYETTRVYLGGGLRPLRGGDGLRWDTAWARAGFSFYEAEYDEVQPWFVLEAKRERGAFERKSLATPMLRLIHRRFFVELGGNRDGGVFNFMFNY